MAQPISACMIGRLKDQRLQVPERLKLALKLWQTEDEVGPNKHQVIIDTVVSILINDKKRHDMSSKVERQVWQTLSSLLNSSCILQSSAKLPAVTIRPAFSQVLLETLEREIVGEKVGVKDGDVLSLLLDCCQCVLRSPALTCVLTSRLDVLVSLCSAVCQLAVCLPVSEVTVPLVSVLSGLTSHLWQHHHRSQLAPSQMVQAVTDKLLQPVVSLNYKLGSAVDDVKLRADMKDETQLSHVAGSLQDFVLATLFHESQQRLFKTYMESVTKQQETSQLPWTVSNVFSKLSAGLQQTEDDQSVTCEAVSPRTVVLAFLPRLFLHAVTVWKQNSQLSFQLFVHLNSYLGVSADDAQEKSEDGGTLAKECVDTLCQLLTLLRQHAVYNVAADRTGGGAQLRYLRHLLNTLLCSSPMCDEVCGCMLELLQCNHLILEPTLLNILQRCSSSLTQAPEGHRMAADRLMAELVSTYSLLQQVPHFYNVLLQLNQQSPRQLTDILPLPQFFERVSGILKTLTPVTAVDIWSKLQEHTESVTQCILAEPHSDADEERLWGSSVLLYMYLSEVRECEPSLLLRVGNRVQLLTSQLEDNVLTPLLTCVSPNKSALLRRSPLLLAVCLGHIKLHTVSETTKTSSQSTPTSLDLPFSWQISHFTQHKKTSAVNAVVRYLGDVLTAQRLLLQQREGGCVDCSPLLPDLTVDTDGDRDDEAECYWNGSVCSVTEETYRVARWHLLLTTCSSLLPQLVHQHPARLAQLMLHVFDNSPSPLPSPSKRYSCVSVAGELLRRIAMLQCREFYHSLVCAMWQRFTLHTHGGESSHPVLATLQRLGHSHIPWHDVKDKEVKSVSLSIQKLLMSSEVQPLTLSRTQVALLQMLRLVPLSDLPGTTRLQCTLGLLAVLRHLDERHLAGLGACDGGGDSVRETVCQLLVVLLEASIGTALFLCLPPHTLIHCLHTLVTQCDSPEHFCLGTLLRKAVVMVMGDFHNVLHLHIFITDLEGQLQKLTSVTLDWKQAKHRALLTITSYVLEETHRYLKKDFFREDVQSAWRQHWRALSVAVEGLVDTHTKQSALPLPPPLLRSFTAVTLQRCADAEKSESSLQQEHLQRVQLVLDSLSLITGNKKPEGGWPLEEVCFIRCVYLQPVTLQALLTPDLTHTVWAALLCCLHTRHYKAAPGPPPPSLGDTHNSVQTSHLGKLKRQRSGSSDSVLTGGKVRRMDNATPATRSKEHLSAQAANNDGAAVRKYWCGGEKSGGVREEDDVVETMTVVLASCPVPVFTRLLQQVLSLQVGRVAQCILLWKRVMQCDTLTMEQRTLLESLSITVLEQFVQVMQQVNSCPDPLTVELGLPVLQCLAAMLTKHKLLSSKGTALCLLCVSLVPLRQLSLPAFLRLLPGVCSVLHAVLVHHPHSTARLLEHCLAIASSVLKECVCRGDQKLLLANPDCIKSMTDCSELVSRLVTLLVSHSTEVQRVVATLVSDYANTAKAFTLLPQVKKGLVSAMYACLDVCDKHAVNQLRVRLPPGVREVFHMLHTDYLHCHKYTGKV
ncbi:hypothetical protein V1264_017143 [Littorina saxatilis]|uniref:Nucleolar 27S pre-rRNA processing Urb2/Npa2 C-terminal domain-containing protein n=2 Tax=Littorina saxatilis TaxID=31220 RepID=A0AAN9GF30_9CAEN